MAFMPSLDIGQTFFFGFQMLTTVTISLMIYVVLTAPPDSIDALSPAELIATLITFVTHRIVVSIKYAYMRPAVYESAMSEVNHLRRCDSCRPSQCRG